MNHRPTPWFHLWLLYCSWAVLSGWLLSAIGWLGGWGYLASFGLCLAGVVITFRRGAFTLPSLRQIRITRRRWRRLPPLLYLLVFLMALLGAVLYAPSNYDALSYRLPRMLHWLAEGHWHWIHTIYHPVNTRASATEWMQVPFLLLGRSDRLLVLPNLISFALLPGLVFSILRNLRISRRVAWNWMWIFPSGYCYALQAGGIGNDLPGAVLFLSAIHFALRARKSRAWSDFAWAAIGMALATGAKTSNVPLGLPWLVAIAPAVPLLWKFPIRSFLLAPVLIMVSFMPNALLNHKHCGDWTGLNVEPVLMRGGDPVLYVSWNSLYAIVHNLTPPILPFNQTYNREVKKLIPSDLKERLKGNFEPAAANLYMPDLMMEEGGPLGLGVSCLLILGAIAGRMNRRGSHPAHLKELPVNWLLWTCAFTSLVALFVMFSKSGLSGIGRYMAPYYLLLIAPFLAAPGVSGFLKSKIWKSAVVLTFAALMLTLVISAARPLWPALTLLHAFNAGESNKPSLKRVWDVYTFYRQRPDAFMPLVAKLPSGADRIGLLSGNTPESSLWKPFGSRRVLHVLPTDTTDSIHQRGIQYIAAGPRTMSESGFPDLQEWCRIHNASVVAEAQVSLLVRYGVETWYILKITPEHGEEMKTES